MTSSQTTVLMLLNAIKPRIIIKIVIIATMSLNLKTNFYYQELADLGLSRGGGDIFLRQNYYI